MINIIDIVESVLKGWDNVTEFIYNTQDEENNYHFKPEYLITVKVAESILLYFYKNRLLDQYSILLEEKTSKAMTRREEEVLDYHKSGVPKKYRARKESESTVTPRNLQGISINLKTLTCCQINKDGLV